MSEERIKNMAAKEIQCNCAASDDKMYEEYLTEIYGTVSVCGMEYDAGRALRELDPTAFRCGMSEYECECGAAR